MKILLVYSVISLKSRINPKVQMHPGLSYISSILKRRGHSITLLVLESISVVNSKRKLDQFLASDRPDIMGFTSVSSQYGFIKRMARFVKEKHKDIFLIIGGTHASLNPEQVIKGPFDALCIGEGEYPLSELCSCLKESRIPTDIKNLWIKSREGKIFRNKNRDFIEDLDLLPFPDRKLWDGYIKKQTGQHLVLISRGCLYDCSYCSNHAFRKLASGKYLRYRSPSKIIEELKHLWKSYPEIHEIFFETENIAIDKDWAFELCRLLEEFNLKTNHTMAFGTNYRIPHRKGSQDLFFSMKKAGFHEINIGLESGSEALRKKVLNRHYSNKEFLDTVQAAHDSGLKVSTLNMVGLPGETFADYQKTVELNYQCRSDHQYLTIFCPYPKTELYKRCIKEGYILPTFCPPEMERYVPVASSAAFNQKQILSAFVWFYYRLYRKRVSFPKRLLETLMRKIETIRLLRRIY